MRFALFALPAALLALLSAPAEDAAGFVPLFNGKDLSGWVNVNTAPGTFFVKDGMIVTTGKPTGLLRTDKQYENFELEMEWRHVVTDKMANSGLFVWGDPLPKVGSPFARGIEVQILANFETDWATSDGDVFSVDPATCVPDRPHPTRKGLARCLPSEKRTRPAGEWNHYKVIARDGAVKLHVNGKEVSGVSQCNPRKGYLCLESEGVECHFRNLKIKELPGGTATPAQTAAVAAGEKFLLTGLDLTGWKTEAGAWTVADGTYKSAGTAPLGSADPVPAGELFFDWKRPAKADGEAAVRVGDAATPLTAAAGAKPGAWARTVVKVPAAATVTFPASAGLEVRNVYSRPAK